MGMSSPFVKPQLTTRLSTHKPKQGQSVPCLGSMRPHPRIRGGLSLQVYVIWRNTTLLGGTRPPGRSRSSLLGGQIHFLPDHLGLLPPC